MLSTLADDEWIQNRRRNRSFAVIWAGPALGTSVVLIVFLVEASRNGQWTGVFVILAVFGSLALYSSLYAYGAARAGLKVTRQEVRLRNPFRSRVIPLSDVGEFTAGLQPARGFFGLGGNPTPGILLETKGGRSYPVWTVIPEHSRTGRASILVSRFASRSEISEASRRGGSVTRRHRPN